MQKSGSGGFTIKDAAKGEVSAVFSTFNVVDKDGDVTLPGAFKDGQEVLISAYGHTSWSGALPVGKGTIRQTATEAIFDGKFFMDTVQGRETFSVIKALGSKGEWSYGFDIVKSSPGRHENRDVRFLEEMDVHEVSPVLLGAGVNTRTLATKGRGAPMSTLDLSTLPDGYADPDPHETLPEAAYKGAVRPHKSAGVLGAWSIAEAEHKAQDADVAGLRSMYAWVDTSADPESARSYAFLHHSEANGPANLRACLIGIAMLNGGGGGTGIPEPDRAGVYNHLASHLIDAGKQVPALRSGTGGTKFYDELVGTLADVASLIAGAERVVALRAKHGKELSHVNSEILEWITEDYKRLRRLLDTPEEDFVREMMRAERLRFRLNTHE